MPKAPAPTRSCGSLNIAFGLANVPVKVYSSTEDSKITRNRFVKDAEGVYHEVGNKNYNKATGEDVAFPDIVLRYTTDDGTKVELSDDEIAAAVGAENETATVETFLPLSLLGEYVTESLLQVQPGVFGNAKKPSVATIKALTLLLDTLEKEGVFALVSYALRGKPRYGALTSDGVLRVLFFEEEVREVRERPTADYSDAEADMARALVQAMTSDTYVPVEDVAAAKVRTYAEAKAAGVEKPTAEAKVASDSVDLMAALSASIEAAKAKKVAS